MERKMKKEDWDAYKDVEKYGKWICEVGETVFDTLRKKMGEEDNAILFSESGPIFTGLPYDYKAFRGLTAYVARRAAEKGLCFVVSPVLKYTGDPMEIVVEDHEMALIDAGVKKMNTDGLITKGEVREALKAAAFGLAGEIPKDYLPWIKKYLELAKVEIDRLEPHGRKEGA